MVLRSWIGCLAACLFLIAIGMRSEFAAGQDQKCNCERGEETVQGDHSPGDVCEFENNYCDFSDSELGCYQAYTNSVGIRVLALPRVACSIPFSVERCGFLTAADLKQYYQSINPIPYNGDPNQPNIQAEFPNMMPIDATVFQMKDLSGIEIVNAVLPNMDFTKTVLRSAKLANALLINSNFYKADLRGANLAGAHLAGAGLRADLRGANLKGAFLVKADLRGADLSGADLTGAELADVIADNANFSGAILTNASFGNASLVNATFTNATLNGTDFLDAVLNRSTFVGATFSTSTSFRWTRLCGTDFTGASGAPDMAFHGAQFDRLTIGNGYFYSINVSDDPRSLANATSQTNYTEQGMLYIPLGPNNEDRCKEMPVNSGGVQFNLNQASLEEISGTNLRTLEAKGIAFNISRRNSATPGDVFAVKTGRTRTIFNQHHRGIVQTNGYPEEEYYFRAVKAAATLSNPKTVAEAVFYDQRLIQALMLGEVVSNLALHMVPGGGTSQNIYAIYSGGPWSWKHLIIDGLYDAAAVISLGTTGLLKAGFVAETPAMYARVTAFGLTGAGVGAQIVTVPGMINSGEWVDLGATFGQVVLTSLHIKRDFADVVTTVKALRANFLAAPTNKSTLTARFDNASQAKLKEQVCKGQPEGGSRVSTRVPGVYESTPWGANDRWDLPNGEYLYFKDEIKVFGGAWRITTKVTFVSKEGPILTGTIIREIKPYGSRPGEFIVDMKFANLNASEMVNNIEVKIPKKIVPPGGVPMSAEGTPLQTLLTIRQMKMAGIDAPASDVVKIVGFKMSSVQNLETAKHLRTKELQWLAAHPDQTLDNIPQHLYADWIKGSKSINYAETAIIQSGYRIECIEVKGGAREPLADRFQEFLNLGNPNLVSEYKKIIPTSMMTDHVPYNFDIFIPVKRQ